MIFPIYIVPHSLAFAIMYCTCATVFAGAIFRDLWIERKQRKFTEHVEEVLMRHLTNGQWKPRPKRWGILRRWYSVWVGVHYSPYNKRWCINLLPFITVWIIKEGGTPP